MRHKTKLSTLYYKHINNTSKKLINLAIYSLKYNNLNKVLNYNTIYICCVKRE